MRTSIRAENACTRLADKRRIYAGCVAALTAYSEATVTRPTRPIAEGGEPMPEVRLEPGDAAGLAEMLRVPHRLAQL
jgi:hypothetical protein